MKSIESILLSLESKCRMDISAPASKDKLLEISSRYPSQFDALKGLYELTDGIEIDVPGTVLYSVEKLISLNKDKASSDSIEIGIMNFGDLILINKEGQILQIEHETGEVFLDWNTLVDFLNDELAVLE